MTLQTIDLLSESEGRMLLTYYCPKCQSIRQFIVEDTPPLRCGRLNMEIVDGFAGDFTIEACDGDLLPVRNIHFIIQDPDR